MKLQLYIAKQLVAAFTLAVAGMLFIALPGIAVSAVHELAGVDTAVLLKYLPLITIGLVPYVLPIGFLLAVVATYGRLAADNEWTAIRMTGAHPLRVFVLPALLCGLLGVGTHWLVSEQLPDLKERQRSFLLSSFKEVIRNLSPGRTEIRVSDFYLAAQFRDGDAFLDAFLYYKDSHGESHEMRAERVEIGFEGDLMKADLENWHMIRESDEFSNERATFYIDLDDLIKVRQGHFDRPRYLSSPELRERLREGSFDEEDALVAAFEVQHRLALGATFILFLLLGAPTGLILRRGTQLGALSVAVGYAIAYYVLSLRLGKAMGVEGVLHPVLAAWMTTGIGAITGLILMRKALRQ